MSPLLCFFYGSNDMKFDEKSYLSCHSNIEFFSLVPIKSTSLKKVYNSESFLLFIDGSFMTQSMRN